MAIIVLTQLQKKMSGDFGPGDAVPYPKAVHTAPADSDVPGDPADLTFWGKSTVGMEPHSSSPKPGGTWYPGPLSRFKCDACDAVLRSQ
ncbi:hypothetical protein [Streptomyces lavendofoliae]|uniref:hypothetical protein n=1 Tax=Streptomyces lavendofoliae TaxID=67314 RepID=UPI003D8E6235